MCSQDVDIASLSEKDVQEFVKQKCASRLLEFQNCADEEECGKKSVALNYCMGSVVCKQQANEFIENMENEDEESAEKAYLKLTQCLSESSTIRSIFEGRRE